MPLIAFCVLLLNGHAHDVVHAQATNTPNSATIPTQPLDPPPTFGLAFVNSAEKPSEPQRIQRGIDSGAEMDRFPIYWDRIETTYGIFDWTAQDGVLQANEAAGLPTLAILLGTPGHYARSASTAATPPIGGSFVREAGAVVGQSTCIRTEGPPAPSGLYNPIFSDGSDVPGEGKTANPDNYWARFVEQAVQRYQPGGLVGVNVRHWEIWNEPDLCHFWSGTPQEYARLLKVAYLVIKLNDPSATVLWGGLAHFANGQWLYDMIDALLADPMAAEYNGFFDAAASHHYSLAWNSFDYTNRVRLALDAAEWENKPIWITESGVPVCDDYPGPTCPSDWRARPLEQAAYIWQNIAYTRLAGGGPIFHFMLHDDCGNTVAVDSPDGFGLVKNEASSYCSPANAEPRPAYTAFQVATQLLADVELIWGDVQQNRQVRRVAFYQPELRQRRLMIWSIVAEDVVATIPATGTSARLVALDGSETLLEPVDGQYSVALPGATNRNWPQDGGYDIGIYGAPFLLIEEDVASPTVSIAPLPEAVAPVFSVQWTAADLGSGVASTALWVRVDGRDWQVWQADLPASGSTIYMGEVDHFYEFGLLAVDRAGNALTEVTPLAQTTVRDKVSVQGTVIDPRGAPVVNAQIQIADQATHTDEDGAFALDVPIGQWDILVAGQIVHRGRSFQGTTQLLLLHATAGNAIVNGDFEDGLTGWQVSGSAPQAVQQQPETGDHALRLATSFVANPGVPGEDGSEGGNSTISQQITVPGGQPYLALAYRFESQETDPGHDRFEV
ncbi:MAG: hypothetical protein KDD84_20115, partial [Caldilineaceae bacterium]|nr:hypothetical protein [Caldilineaceae bacterium]